MIPCHLPSMQAARATGQGMCGPSTTAKTSHLAGKQEALGVTGQTPESLTKANSHDNHAASVVGQTLEGNSNKANSSPPDVAQPPVSHADLGSTIVFSVNSSSSFSNQGHIHGTPTTFPVDTGSIISIMKSTVWVQIDPGNQQLTPYNGPQLISVEGTPLSIQGKASADIFLGRERFQVPMIVVDQLSDVILGLDFLEDQRCTIDIASRVLLVGDRQLRLPLVTGD